MFCQVSMMALQHILLSFFPFSQFVCLFVFFAFLFMFVSLFCLVLFSPLQVYKPSSQARHFEVPWDFFNKTAEEVKSEQMAR